MLLLKGEKRSVVMSIVSSDDVDFEISTATVEIHKRSEVISNIPCTISEHDISFSIDSNELEKGNYDIEVTFSIGPEILKRKTELQIVS